MDDHIAAPKSPAVPRQPKRTHWLLVIELIILCAIVLTEWWIFQPGQLIVGTWKDEASPTQMTFFPDGTVSETNTSWPVSGDYRFLSNNQLRIDFGGLGALLGPWILTMTLSDRNLVVIDQAGHTTRFDKVEDGSISGVIRSWFDSVGYLIRGQGRPAQTSFNSYGF